MKNFISTFSDLYIETTSNIYVLFSRLLSVRKFFDVDFLCNFHMSNYPFDTQDCNAEIELGKSRQFVELFAQNMEYDGEMHVMEYIITEWKDYKEKNKLVLKISLGRSLMSVILTTMLPTIILILVALSTNYYNKQHFKTIIPVNLTSMLSMVTLYVGMSSRLPRTSYLKMIDVWLFFSLFIPFINIILHGYLEFQRSKLEGTHYFVYCSNI